MPRASQGFCGGVAPWTASCRPPAPGGAWCWEFPCGSRWPGGRIDMRHQEGRAMREFKGIRWVRHLHPWLAVSMVGIVATAQGQNHPPVSNAGPDQAAHLNVVVQLDGTGSSDVDHDPLTYAWTSVSGPGVTLSDPVASRPTFTPTVEGDYTFELVVNDTHVNSAADQVLIVVRAGLITPDAIDRCKKLLVPLDTSFQVAPFFEVGSGSPEAPDFRSNDGNTCADCIEEYPGMGRMQFEFTFFGVP